MSFDIFDLDLSSFIADNIWILLLVPIILLFGVSFGWKKLIGLYQMQGKPLRPLGVIVKEATSLMFKEDIYCVVTRKGENVESLLWLTWTFFWKWLTSLTIAIFTLSILNLFEVLPIKLNNAVMGWAWFIVILIWLYGVGHLRKVFAHRFSILEKMFNVASSEMKYDGGANAKIYIYQYVLISGWKQVYYPEETQIMYSVNRFKATEQGRQNAFQAAFDSSVTDKNSWSYEWDTANNRVICTPIPFLPSNVSYPFPDKHPWNEFPLGKTFGDEEVVWDVATLPHILVAGTTGSGKSVTQRTILLHAMQSPDWRVLLIDPKQVELSQYPGHPNVLKLATEIEEAFALIQQLEQEMMNRYARMKESGVNYFKSLATVPPAILLMVDEVFALLEITAGASRTDPIIKEQNEMKAAMTLLVGKIARLGRAAGIHMVLATQRPDAKVLPGEVKANLDARIAQGRMDKTPSFMTLDSDAATKIPAIKGRAVYRAGGDGVIEFQAYFLAPENLPEFLELSAMIVRGEGDFLFEDDEPEVTEPQQSTREKIKFKKPEIKFNLGDKFNNWVEKKKLEMEENEARAGRSTAEPKSKVIETQGGYIDAAPIKAQVQYTPAEERARIEQEALKELGGAQSASSFKDETFTNIVTPSDIKKAETLFSPEDVKTESFDFEYPEDDFYDDYDSLVTQEENIQSDSTSNNYEIEDDIFDFDDEDLEIVNFEEEERAEKASRTRLAKPENLSEDTLIEDANLNDEYDTIDDFENYEPQSRAEETFNIETKLTVADVLRIAAERGVPIPASELLAALKAEAAAQAGIKQPATQKIVETKTIREEASKTAPTVSAKYEAVKPQLRQNNAVPAPVTPTNRIPSPPKLNKESAEILAKADFGEHLLDPEEVSGENLPPWMVNTDLDNIEPATFNPQGNKIPGIERNPEDFLRPPNTEESGEPVIKPKRPKLF
jgi:hypothetical protein